MDAGSVVYVGIDPGKKGAVAAVYDEGRNAESWHVPILAGAYNLPGMLRLLYRFQKLQKSGVRVVVGVEEQNPRPTDSKHTVKMVGMGQAYWEMACAANHLAFQLISPLSWKRKYVNKGAHKEASILAAVAIYPNASFPLKKDEARAEALLIADYLMRAERNLNFPKRRAG
jgi:hypothetical protein